MNSAKGVLSLVFGLLAMSLSAQETTSRVERDGEDQFIVDLTYENFINGPDNVDFRWYNRGVNVQLFYDFHVVKNRFTIGLGGGFSSQNYYGNGFLNTTTVDGSGYSDWAPRTMMYRRNKLSVNYLEIPLEFRYRSNLTERGYRWKITLGARYGYLVNIHDKLILDNGDKFKTYNFPYVEDFRYGAYMRLGYGKVNLNASYIISPFFKDGHGPEMNQISIGIGVMPF